MELGCVTLLVCGCVHQPGSSWTPIPLGFYGALVTWEISMLSLSSFSPLWGMGVGRKFQASNHGLVFLVTSRLSGVHPESPPWNKGLSYHPGNPKGFRSSVSGTGAKDQMLEQKMLLVFLSLRKLQAFLKLCPRNQGQKPKYIFSIISHNIFNMKNRSSDPLRELS